MQPFTKKQGESPFILTGALCQELIKPIHNKPIEKENRLWYDNNKTADKRKMVKILTATKQQHEEDLKRLRILRPIDDDFMRLYRYRYNRI